MSDGMLLRLVVAVFMKQVSLLSSGSTVPEGHTLTGKAYEQWRDANVAENKLRLEQLLGPEANR